MDHQHTTKPLPGKQMLADARAGFVRQRSSLAKWCKAQGISPAWASQVLTGKRRGPQARALRSRIARAAGLTNEATS